jgi:hypothetical protein
VTPEPAANIKSAFTSPTPAIPLSATNFTAVTRIYIWRWSKAALCRSSARLILSNQAPHACAVRFAWRSQPMEFSCEPEPWFAGFCDANTADCRE